MALKDVYTQESGWDLDPLFVIVDGSGAITLTVMTAFLGCPRGMCWVHVVRNVDKKLLGVRMRNGGRCLGGTSISCSLQHPQGTSNRELEVVVQYIQETWIDFGLENWFEGFQEGFPSIYNGLERANRCLKDDYTIHVKLGLA